jgi:hypothetical protein
MGSTRFAPLVEDLASTLALGVLLERVRARWGAYELLEHWRQGEFHHDVVLRVAAKGALPGGVLVVSTNCNGGVKEVAWFREVPEPAALWHGRCPNNPEFYGEPPEAIAVARTEHWFDPCELLSGDARSEYREEYRERQSGGGWVLKKTG